MCVCVCVRACVCVWVVTVCTEYVCVCSFMCVHALGKVCAVFPAENCLVKVVSLRAHGGARARGDADNVAVACAQGDGWIDR